jgi:hypothetical protein
MGRYWSEPGQLVVVEVPEVRVEAVLDAVIAVHPLTHGDYDRVSFAAATGQQMFRARNGARNAATDDVMTVPCQRISFFVGTDEAALGAVMDAIYAAHPYEEPVIYLMPTTRMRAVRGSDDANPNRFWNGTAEDWVPKPHRG